MGFLDFIKKFAKKDENDGNRVKINPFVQKDVDPFLSWEKKNKLGDGSYGEIYRGIQLQTQQEAAIKQISIDGDEDLQEYMVEIDILVKCKHAKIVGLYEAFLFDSTLWLCLEFCEMGALDNVMIELDKGLTERQIQYVCNDLCDALAFLHNSGVIHRDLKAGNILLTANANIKLADFGVSAFGDGPSVNRHSFIGSNYWMSPEVMVCETYSEIPYGTKTDIWSLGITLIELAQMLPPHHTMQPMRVAIRVLKGDPPRLERPRIWSSYFNDFIAKCLVKSPEHRASIQELQAHEFLTKVDTTFQKDILNLIAEFRTTPEVEVQEINIEERDRSNVRDSVFSLSGLDTDNKSNTPDFDDDKSLNDTKMSDVYEDEEPKGQMAPPVVFKVDEEPAAQHKIENSVNDSEVETSLKSGVKPVDSSNSLDVSLKADKSPKSVVAPVSPGIISPPSGFDSSPLEKSPSRNVSSHSLTGDSEEQEGRFVHPPVVIRSGSSATSPSRKKPPAPLPKRPSQKKLNGGNSDAVPPSPVFSATVVPASGDDSAVKAADDYSVLASTNSLATTVLPSTNLRHMSYLGEVNSARSSISSETIDSDREEESAESKCSPELVEDVITEVLSDENQDPSVPAVVLDVMQEAFSSVTDIDEMINSTFSLAIEGHDVEAKTTPVKSAEPSPVKSHESSPVTDIDTVVVEEEPNNNRNTNNNSHVNNSKSQDNPTSQRYVGLGVVSARITKDYSQDSLLDSDSLSASTSSTSFPQAPASLDVPDRDVAVVRRTKEDRFNSVVIKKKRVYTDDSGKQVVSMSTRTVRKGEENKLYEDILSKRQELRDQKLLNKQHQKQDMDFKMKAQNDEVQLEARFKAEKAQIQREFEMSCNKIKKDYEDEERVHKANLDRVLKVETGRWKQRHDRSLRDFREDLKRKRKQLAENTPREDWKDSVRSQTKEKEREDERRRVSELLSERSEKEVQIQSEYQKKFEERKVKLTRDLQLRERRFCQERHEQEERHVYEKYELKTQHLTEYFTLKKAQAIQKHEREIDQIRRYYETKRQTLLESHAQERKLKPKLLRKEKLTRDKMFKASLDLRTPPLTENEIRIKFQEFYANEDARMQAENKRMEKKLEQTKDDFERRVARIDAEIRQAQNEKRQMIILKESDQRKDLDLNKKTELKEFNSRRAAEKEHLELRQKAEMDELRAELSRQTDESQIQVMGEDRHAGAATRTLTSA